MELIALGLIIHKNFFTHQLSSLRLSLLPLLPLLARLTTNQSPFSPFFTEISLAITALGFCFAVALELGCPASAVTAPLHHNPSLLRGVWTVCGDISITSTMRTQHVQGLIFNPNQWSLKIISIFNSFTVNYDGIWIWASNDDSGFRSLRSNLVLSRELQPIFGLINLLLLLLL